MHDRTIDRDGAGGSGRERRRFLRGNLLLPVAAFAVLLAVWWIGHGATKFLPSPIEVVRSFPKFITQADLLSNVIATFRRVVVGLAIATVLAVTTVVLMASSPRVARVLQVYVFVTLSIPSIAAALFALMIFGFSDVGVYSAIAVITYPFITIGIRDGVASVDKSLLELADVYRFGFWRRLRHITIPNLEPSLFAALRNAHALAWKVAIISEVFSARNGIGGQFMRAFDFFNLDVVILWLAVFLASVFVVEYGILRQIERRLFRWRQTTASSK